MNYTKIAAVLAAMAISLTVTASAEAPYKDIGNTTAKTAIDYLYDTHCLTFIKSDFFYPAQTITRGELAQLIYGSMTGFQQNAIWVKDTTSRQETDAVSAVIARGIMKNEKDGMFHPDELVDREDFAAAVYHYLKYYQMAEPDGKAPAYADENEISPADLPMVQTLHSKNIMVGENNFFRPKQMVTRADAASVFFHLVKSDGTYISHVSVEMQALKALTAEYGSSLAYFNAGTMYWKGDTLVLAVKGGASKNLVKRIKEEVTPKGVVVLRNAKYSRFEYDLITDKAVRALVKEEGVRDYVGAEPDYANEQIVLTLRRPVDQAVMSDINKAVGAGVVRIEVSQIPGQQKATQK